MFDACIGYFLLAPKGVHNFFFNPAKIDWRSGRGSNPRSVSHSLERAASVPFEYRITLILLLFSLYPPANRNYLIFIYTKEGEKMIKLLINTEKFKLKKSRDLIPFECSKCKHRHHKSKGIN